GNGTVVDSSKSVPVSNLTNAVAISAGTSHTCAVLADGTARCWGFNGNGQLGNGTAVDSSTPVAGKGLTNAVGIAAGGIHSLALLADGTDQCWGYNSNGQLGHGSNINAANPAVASGLSSVTNAVAISAGGFHSCAVLANGTVKCWGDNGNGQLGNGTA